MRPKKDVVFLCQFFYPEYISSAQLPFDTARALTKEGFSVGVLCGYPREYLQGSEIPRRETVEGVTIHRLKYLQLDRSGFLGRLVNYFSFTFMVLLHLPEIGRYRSVVVYSNPPILPWIASWAKALFGTRLVFVSYDLYPEVATVTDTLRQGSMICRLMNHINRCVFRRGDRIVSLASEQRAYILANRDVAPDKVTVIPNWYPDENQAPSPGENRFRTLAGGRFVVSYFGNMGTMQDMRTILDAIRELRGEKDILFLFAGHGNKLEKLKNIVAQESIPNVAVYDFLHGSDFQDALAASHCALVSLEEGATGLCVPSKTYCYMRRGIPLLAVMDKCDIVRDIEQGAGIWVRNGESHWLAQAILDLKQNPRRLEEMSRVCREFYREKYALEKGTGKYVALFRDLLDTRRQEGDTI